MAVHDTNKRDPSNKANRNNPLEFFNTVYNNYKKAEKEAGGPVNRYFNIAGFTILLRFAGPALIPYITPALNHLTTQHAPEPDLTVCLWDSISTHTEISCPPWEMDDYLPRGEVRGYNTDRIHIAFQLGFCVLSMLDIVQNTAIFWIRSARHAYYSESSHPIKTILHWWMREQGLQLVHAASVGMQNGGVLVAGRGGSGKSTTALACLLSEMLFLGDDKVLISRKPIPFAYSAYNSATLNADHLQKLPQLIRKVSNADNLDAEKALIYLYNFYSERVAVSLPVRGIVVPQITGQTDSKLTRVSPMTAIKALAPSTLFQMPGAGPKDFREITEFVKHIPCFLLELGTCLQEVPETIMQMLSNDSG